MFHTLQSSTATTSPALFNAVQADVDEIVLSHVASDESLKFNANSISDLPAVAVIKVLHLINGEHFSGAERVQQLLGKTLHNFSVDSHFACLKPGKFAEVCGLPVDRVTEVAMRGRFDLTVVGQLVERIRNENFQLLHAHTPRTAMIAAMVSLRSGIPWCYHVHSPTIRDSTRGWVNRINAFIERVAIKNCDHLITVSKSLRREMLKQGVSRQKLSVVPNGVAEVLPILPQSRIANATWTLGLIALMRPRKGVEIALQALALLSDKKPDIRLQLIGSFETSHYQQEIMRLVEDLGLQDRVCWTGFTKDVTQAIQKLDALLLPSLFGEGMPMVVLEAIAAGVPVVATRVEGTPEVIRDGVEGYLAEPRDAKSFAEAIERMTGDRVQWAEISKRALLRHRKKFTDLKMAQRVAAAYRKIVQRG